MSTPHRTIFSAPWNTGGIPNVSVAKMAQVDAVCVGLLHAERPSADEFLLTDGVDDRALLTWVHGGCTQDRVFAAALEHGSSQGLADDTGLRTSGRQKKGELHALWVCAPESLDSRMKWCACFLRTGKPYEPRERDALESLVRLWQARFNNPDEEGLSYMLVGEDQRLIHSDPACRLRMLRGETMPQQVLAELDIMRTQRWPDAGRERMNDVVMTISEDTMWACAHDHSVWSDGSASHTLVELRPLEPGELPAVGPIDDPRVAVALGYLHDHYNESPTLTDLAAAVDVSPFHFHRVFTKHVGVSPKQYQLLKQLQVAKWRLRCGRETIGQIAGDVGFANHAHFTSTFRRMLGVSPTEYQRSSAEVSGAAAS